MVLARLEASTPDQIVLGFLFVFSTVTMENLGVG